MCLIQTHHVLKGQVCDSSMGWAALPCLRLSSAADPSPLLLKSIKNHQPLAESGLGIGSLVEELGCCPETVCQLYELLAKAQRLCSWMLGLSKSQENCLEERCSRSKAPCSTPLPAMGIVTVCFQ